MAVGRVRSPDLLVVKIVIDMNLTPTWVEYFGAAGIHAQHWSDLGDSRANDRVIMEYAREHGVVVFTHDLDFGNILAVTHATGPSVLQVRTQDPLPQAVGDVVLSALHKYGSLLEHGALVTIEPEKLRARVLPIVPGMKR
jgi:predicted nuclease of predicted toxin-antitoxin system